MKSRQKWTDYAVLTSVHPVLIDPALLAQAQPSRRRHKFARNPEPKETDITRIILDGLRRHPDVLRVERSNTGAGRLMQNGKPGRFVRFGFVGQPDITGVARDGRVIAIEVKRRSTRNSTSEAQKAYLSDVRAAGGLAGVATSYEEAVAIVEGRA
jgi:hypothetical protein